MVNDVAIHGRVRVTITAIVITTTRLTVPVPTAPTVPAEGRGVEVTSKYDG